jgi:hypothetical protein
MRPLYRGKSNALIFTEFSEIAAKAIALFFSERGLILLLLGRRRGEFDTLIATGTPLAWGEVPSSSSSATSSSPSSSPLILISLPHNLCRSEP